MTSNMDTGIVRVPDTDEEPLTKAWASSSIDSPDHAIDKIFYFNSFTSGDNDPFPWLAIDLVIPKQILAVHIVEAKDNLASNIEARVGYDRPYFPGQVGDVYTQNTVCGISSGVGATNKTINIYCSSPIEGKYVTLQSLTR